MVRKRKRAPGAGRPAKGEFAALTAVLSVRMPSEMRDKLTVSAGRRKPKAWSLTQEILYRLQRSFDRERDERRDPASRALCYLLAEVIATVAHNSAEGAWRSDPFAFRAIKLAFTQILDALEPAGEIRPPVDRERSFPGDMWISPGTLLTVFGGKTPEEMASFVSDVIRMKLSSEPEPSREEAEGPLATTGPMPIQQEFEFGMSDARRHLGPSKESIS
jgi:hypothetical protein